MDAYNKLIGSNEGLGVEDDLVREAGSPAGKLDVLGREIPEWGNVEVFHTTSKQGAKDIAKNGYRILGKEQGGYYGNAVSFTKNLDYSKQFGDVTTRGVVSPDAKILNLNDPADWDVWRNLIKDAYIGDYRSIATKNGIDGVFDAGAGDLFIYNPKVVKTLK